MLSLERDFIRTIDYCELSEENRHAYSDQYAKILMLCSSEIEANAKIIAKRISGNDAPNFGGCREIITGAYHGIHGASVNVPRYRMTIFPWDAWKHAKSAPGWWVAYNKVKHDRSVNFREANQANALSSLCALLLIVIYQYEAYMQPFPQLLDCGFPGRLLLEGGPELPGLKL